jgi:hypothetical protein
LSVAKKGEHCPLLQKKCIEDRCKFWTHIRGKHPQSEQEIDMPDCAVKWLPVLMIEMTQMERQTGAAVESFRNESARSAQRVAGALSAAAIQQQLPEKVVGVG